MNASPPRPARRQGFTLIELPVVRQRETAGFTLIEPPVVRQGQRAAFTLIELLVVISIIALLVAILLPALAGARTSVINAGCLSNMRQLAVGMRAYSEIYDDYVVPCWDSTNYTGNWRFWPFRLADEIQIEATPEGMYSCPARVWTNGSHSSLSRQLTQGNIGINSFISGGVGGTYERMDDIKNATETFMVVDCGAYQMWRSSAGNPTLSYWYLPGWNPTNFTGYEATMPGQQADVDSGRHFTNRLNFLAVEGHAESEPSADFYLNLDRWSY